MAPVLSGDREKLLLIGQTPIGSLSYFPAPLDVWPIIAPVPAEIRTRSDDPRAYLPPSPLAGARAEPVVNVTAHILELKFARASPQLSDRRALGDF